jgi:ligand-binding sensor domain-containing protein/serine phosphatase RsbU (regulator of sigma subunit)/GAF domain-containing protein
MKFFLLIVGLSLSPRANADSMMDLVFKHLNKNQGLSSNYVKVFCQDKQGFIWVGTENGLNRYDGYNFQVFRHKNGDNFSLPNNDIKDIIEDSDDKSTWIVTSGGLARFDKNLQRFEKITLQAKTLFSGYLDIHHNIWLCTDMGLYIKKHGTTDYQLLEKTRHKIFQKILIDKKGNHWVVMDKNVGLIQPQDGSFVSVIDNVRGEFLYEDSKGQIWCGTNQDGLFRIDDFQQKKITRFNKGKGHFTSDNIAGLIEDVTGKYWVAVRDGGLYYLDTQNNVPKGYFYDIYHPEGLHSNALTTLFKDKFGNLWLGSFNKGIGFLDKWRKPFAHYKFNFKPNGLANNNVRCIYQDKDEEIWIGTKEGGCLSKFERSKGSFTHYCLDAQNPTGLNDDFIFSLQDGESGYLWVGTYRGGLNYLHKATGTFRHYQTDEQNDKSITQNAIYALLKDKNSQLWIGTLNKGLDMLKSPQSPFIHYKDKEIDHSLTSNNSIRALWEDHKGRLWVGSQNGLHIFDRQAKKFKSFLHSDTNPHSISHSNITCIFEDSKNNFWVATLGGGLNLMNREKGTFFAFTEDDGLPSNIVIGILEDAHGNLWLSTANGISKFTPPKNLDFAYLIKNKGQFRNYDVSDGLQGNEFAHNAQCKLTNGEMLFGGSNGFNLFHPDSIGHNPYKPTVILTDFRLFNKSVEIGKEDSLLKQHISRTQELILNYNQNTLTFVYIALNFSSSEKNQYAYRLKGLEKDWNYVGDLRTAHYTNLDPGEYFFEVKASNNDKIWNEKPIHIKIIILPPWWETWWFRIFLITFIVSSFITFYQLRMHNIRKQKIRLERLVDKRTFELQEANAELAGQRHEILSQNEELFQQSEELQQQRDYLKDANEMISQRLEDIKILSEIGQQITSSVKVFEIIEKVYHHLNDLMDAPNFEIGVLDRQKQVIDYYGYLDKNTTLNHNIAGIHQEGTFTRWCTQYQKDVFIQDVDGEINQYFTPEQSAYYTKARSKTLIYLPLLIEDRMIGIVVVKSFQKYAYTDVHFNILKNLAAYIVIALDNAQAYQLIEASNEQIKASNEQIQAKNRQIHSSIKVAQNIQQAILPYRTKMDELLKDYFIIYKPKDGVSGDFYWLNQIQNKTMLVVADCTGHGVPGAFMTLIGNTLLDKIIKVGQITNPANVLNRLHQEIQIILRQKESKNNSNGMDVVVLCMEKMEDDKTKIVFCGAKNPIYYISATDTDQKINILEGDRKSIGGEQNENISFTNQEIILTKNSLIYLGSDGLIDQNNPKRKTFGAKKLMQLLEDNADLSLSKQQALLEIALDMHQQGTEQRDDILFMGIKMTD